MVTAPLFNTTSPANDTIVADWPEVENAVLYTFTIIQQGSNSRFDFNTTDSSITFTDLEAGTNYCIKGTSWDAEGRQGDDYTACQITRKHKP